MVIKGSTALFQGYCWKTVVPLLYVQDNVFYIIHGSCTSQIRKFKGISRVIKGSTAHVQGYFWNTVVTLLYVNKISGDFSHLFQDFV